MAGTGEEIVVRIVADTTGLQAGMQDASASVAQAQATIAESGSTASATTSATTAESGDAWAAMAARITVSADAAKASIAAFVAETIAPLQLLADVAAGTATSLDALNAQDAALQSAFAAGTISAEQYGTAMDALDAQTAPLVASMQAAAAASAELSAAQMAQAAPWVEATAAIDANTGALVENSAAQEGNAATAFRFRGLYGSIGQVMTALLSPIGLAATAVGVLGFDALQQSGRVTGLSDALLVTGNSAGVSASQVDAWAQKIGSSTSTIGDAQAAYQQLAMSGQFVGTELKDAGDAATIFAHLADESSQQAASAVERMATDPASALKYLTAAQQAEVQSLIDVGDKAEAGRVAVADFAGAMRKAAQEANNDAGVWTRLGDAIANAWDATGRAVNVGTGGGTLAQKLAAKQSELAGIEGGTNFNMSGEVPQLAKQIAALQEQIAAENLKAREQAVSHDWSNPVTGYGAKGLQVDTQAMHAHEAVAHMGYQQRIDYERTFWEHLYATASKGSAEYIAAYQHLSEAAHKAATSHPYVGAADSGWNVGTLGSNDRSMMATEGRQISARQHAEALQRSLDVTGLQSGAAHAEAPLAAQSQHLQAQAGMGIIDGSAAIAQEQSIADAIYAIKLAELEKEKALADTKPQEAARINAEIVRLQDAHTAQMITLSDKATGQQIKDAQSLVSPIVSAFGQVTTGYIEGTLTRQQAELRIGDAILAESINFGIKKLANHIAIEEAKTIATVTGNATRVASTVAAEAEAAAVHAIHAIEWIVTEAAKAAASAFTALAGIPIIGPVLAVGAAIAASAEVLSFAGSVSSAEGGWERVPMDGMPTILHKDERVMTADQNNRLDGLLDGGGNGGETHVHIHAMDSSSFEGFLKRNPQALMNALGHAGRTGYAT